MTFMKQHVLLVAAISLCLLAVRVSAASNQIPAKQQTAPIAIVHATIHTVSGPVIEDGTILFDKGIITAIGPAVTLPPGTEIISGTGKHVYPGLLSADTEVGMIEIRSVRATIDRTETGSINPNARADKVVDPESELIPVARANGITMMVPSPTGGLLSGTSAVMLMDGWTTEDMTFKAPAALIVQWPSMVIRQSPPATKSKEDQRKLREYTLQQIGDAFDDARAYMIAKEAERKRGTSYHNQDSRWEAMLAVLHKEIPVVVRADEIQQIEAAVAWAEQEQVRLVIAGGYDAWRVADLLKAHDVPVIVQGTHRLPQHRMDGYDDPFTLPVRLFKAGVLFAIASGEEAAHERNLPYSAATASAFGLPPDEALKSITLNPAKIFGIADRVGSLEVGKDATLILTTGDPLEITSEVVREFIQGRSIDLTSKHTILHDKYREKYRRLNKQ